MGGRTLMTIVELKDFITSGTVPSDFMIFVNKENPFLALQYAQAIGKLAPGGMHKIKSIYEPQQSSLSLLTVPTGAINILFTDTFDERAEDYSQFEDTIVICEQLDKSIDKNVEKYVIKMPKFENWQICDYAKTLCPALDEDDLMWLITASEGNIYRVINELDKVNLFEKEDQKEIFTSIRFDPQTDLYKIDLFTIVNALVDGDMLILFDFLKRDSYDSLEPVVIANRVFTSLKNILLVTQNPGIKAEECGVSASQYSFLKRKYHSLNIDVIKQKLKFLTNFDLDLKTSRLDMSKRAMMNYLVSNLYYKITL
jgi:hypothetical protein